MSFAAIQWALTQDVGKSPTKFVLVAMASFVNSEGAEMLCWPSYAAIARVTDQDPKTVEAAVYRLKQLRFIVDTGQRKGDTGKVVVYRLNDPVNGVITPGPQGANANGTRPQNTTENGGIGSDGNPPKFPPNPPKFPGQSPQISGSIPPKTGSGTRNGIRNGIRKEPEDAATAAAAFLPEVPKSLLVDWLKVRKNKRAGPVTETVAQALKREAGKADLSAEAAVRYCCEAGWQNFTFTFYQNREGLGRKPAPVGKHAGFAGKDYREGVSDDGSFH